MDFETAEFYDRVRNAYLGIAERERKRFRVIDANGSVEAIHSQVAEIVVKFLARE